MILAPNVREIDLETELRAMLETMSVRDASDALAEQTGLKRRKIYQMALSLDQG